MITQLIVFIFLFLLEIFYFRVAHLFNIMDKPNSRSSHTQITLRGGGIIFYIGVLLFGLFYDWDYIWFFIGLTLISIVSFMDDIRSIPNRYRLMIHFLAMFFMFYQWGILNFAYAVFILLSLIVCTGIINAYNFMDGINGIMGGYSLVVLFSLIYINNEIVSFIKPEFMYTVLLSLVVFNFFNFRKRAKCFAGDVGSVTMAFIILFMLGKLILITTDYSYFVLLAVYGVDSVLTIVHRLLLRENIFEAHRKHAYQLMANELRMSHITVSLFYMVLQAVVTVGFLFLPVMHWIYVGGVIIVLCVAYVLFMNKYFVLHYDSI